MKRCAAILFLLGAVGFSGFAQKGHFSFWATGGKFRTHANGNAYDRIFFSEPMLKGAAGLKFERVFVQPHTHGKGAEKNEFTDHFPVTAIFTPIAKK